MPRPTAPDRWVFCPETEAGIGLFPFAPDRNGRSGSASRTPWCRCGSIFVPEGKGVGVDPADLPAGGALQAGPVPGAMMAYRRQAIARRMGHFRG